MKKLLGIALASAAAGLCLSALKKASDEQTVELSPVKRSSPNKKAILVVSFGTSYGLPQRLPGIHHPPCLHQQNDY